MCEKRSLSISLHVFSPWQSPNKFGFAHLAYRKRSFFMQVFSPRHSSGKPGSALGLSKTFVFVQQA